jgi:hypothetical protein
MKTLTDLKRAITVGSQLRCIDHFQEKLKGQTRTVTKAQGNGYFYTFGNGERYWMPYPPASGITFDGASFTIRYDEKKVFTLELIDEGET